jgi:hypothetical protein
MGGLETLANRLMTARDLLGADALPLPMTIRTSEHLVRTLEDWSAVRSPGRARRRLRRGFAQRIVFRTVPRDDAIRLLDGTLVMHPVAYERLKAALA